MMSQVKFVVVSSSDEEPIREGFDTRTEADARVAELSDRDDEKYAVAEMPVYDYSEFERCGNRSATFTKAELTALGVL